MTLSTEFSAIWADISTASSGITALAKRLTILTNLLTSRAKIYTMFALIAIQAKIGAAIAHFLTIITKIHAFRASTAAFTQVSTITTILTAIRAESSTILAYFSAILTNKRTLRAPAAVTTSFHTIRTIFLTIFTKIYTVCALIAIQAKIGAAIAHFLTIITKICTLFAT